MRRSQLRRVRNHPTFSHPCCVRQLMPIGESKHFVNQTNVFCILVQYRLDEPHVNFVFIVWYDSYYAVLGFYATGYEPDDISRNYGVRDPVRVDHYVRRKCWSSIQQHCIVSLLKYNNFPRLPPFRFRVRQYLFLSGTSNCFREVGFLGITGFELELMPSMLSTEYCTTNN